MITRYQWDNLKEGDVILSPLGRERIVIRYNEKAALVVLAKISGTGVTYYNFTDIYKKYSIKPSPQNCRIKRNKQ